MLPKSEAKPLDDSKVFGVLRFKGLDNNLRVPCAADKELKKL